MVQNDAAIEDDVGQRVVAPHQRADLEARRRRLERELRAERPAIASLVVPLARDRHVGQEQTAGAQPEHHPGRQEPAPSPLPGQPREDRHEQQRVRHFRKRVDSQKDRRHDVARRPEQPAHARQGPLGCLYLFIEPAEVRQQAERKVEELGRDPDEIHRHDRHHHERAGQRRRRRGAHARVQEQVAAPDDEREQQRVKNEEPVRAEHADERRRDERIGERFPVVVPRRVGIRLRAHPDERRPKHHPRLDDVAPLFQEEPGGSTGELAPDANEVLAAVLEVAIRREAVPHHVIGGFVALDADGGFREVDRQRQPAVHGEHGDDQEQPRTPIQPHGGRLVAGGDLRVHTGALPVRNERSDTSTPLRCVARETRCRMS